MAGELDQICALLSRRDVSGAVRAALDWLSGEDPMLAAQALGKSMAAVIEKGEQQAVEAFIVQLGSFVDPPVVERMRSALGDMPAPADDVWTDNLLAVTQERLGRECRDAIRLRDYYLALDRAKSLLTLEVGDQGIEQRCRLFGTVLGSVENHQSEAGKLWERVAAKWAEWKMPDNLRDTVLASQTQMYDSVYQRRAEASEIEWRRQLTDTSLSLKGDLPPTNRLGDPTEEDIERFDKAVRELTDAAAATPQEIAMSDALLILAEYTPRELAKTAERAGVEQRIHTTLGPRARQVTTQVFRRMADVGPLRSAVMDAGENPPLERYRDIALDLMAALEWKGYAPFALSVLRERGDTGHMTAAIRVVGACAGAEALGELTDIFLKVTKGKVVDGAERRLAIQALQAMARVVRRQEIVDQRRDQLVAKLVKQVSANDTDLNIGIARDLCLYRPDKLAPKIRDWAVRQFIFGLWRPDKSVSLGGRDLEEAKRRPLGYRQGFVTALTRMGGAALPALHAFVTGDKARVTGAFVAVAEILGKIANSSSVEPLSHMLRNVQLADDDFGDEDFYDAERGELVPLNRDHIAGAIAEALLGIATPGAIDALWGIRDQMASGQGEAFGPMTAKVVGDLPERPAAGSGESIPSAREPIMEGGGLIDAAPHAEVQDLIADLSSGGFLGLGASKARTKRIAALQALGSMTPVDALWPIVQCLGDKDAMVRASAKTALISFNGSGVAPAVREAFISRVLEELADGESKARESLLEMLEDVALDKEPWASSIREARETHPSPALNTALAQLRVADGEESSEEGETSASTFHLHLLELKQQYFQARRAWVAGGKQGPPPPRPEELDLE